LTEPLPWPNSTLLSGDIPAAVATLRQTAGDDLHIMCSGALIRSLSPLGLIDEYMLSIHPLVLGTGHRLFADGFAPTRFDLVEATPTTHRRHHRHPSTHSTRSPDQGGVPAG
jgi:dihydrofolate reductase